MWFPFPFGGPPEIRFQPLVFGGIYIYIFLSRNTWNLLRFDAFFVRGFHFEIYCTPRKTQRTMENPAWMKMHSFYWQLWFSNVMLFFRDVSEGCTNVTSEAEIERQVAYFQGKGTTATSLKAWVVQSDICSFCFLFCIPWSSIDPSGQIIVTSHDLTPNGG